MDASRSNSRTTPGPAEAPVKVGPNATRPGPLGKPVAIMLACALALAAVAWAGAAFWGEAQDTDAEGTPGAQPSLSEQAPAGPSPSSGEASAPSQSDPANTAPAETDPTPPSATGGDSQSVTPDGTQSAPATAPQQ
jgi:cytoskeletal protein RodZ